MAEFYAQNVDVDDAEGYPFLEKLLVHQECELATVFGLEDEPKAGGRFGVMDLDGRFYRLGTNGEPFRDRDRTIASLLASLHYLVAADDFNRFFSYVDELRYNNVGNKSPSDVEWFFRNLTTEQSRKLARRRLGQEG